MASSPPSLPLVTCKVVDASQVKSEVESLEQLFNQKLNITVDNNNTNNIVPPHSTVRVSPNYQTPQSQEKLRCTLRDLLESNIVKEGDEIIFSYLGKEHKGQVTYKAEGSSFSEPVDAISSFVRKITGVWGSGYLSKLKIAGKEWKALKTEFSNYINAKKDEGNNVLIVLDENMVVEKSMSPYTQAERYYWSDMRPKVFPKYEGKWIAVHPSKRGFVFESEYAAMASLKPDEQAFITCIGSEETLRGDLAEPDAEQLPDSHKPRGWPNMQESTKEERATCEYVSGGVRRWITLWLLKKDKKFLGVQFLLDSGATSNYILPEIAQQLDFNMGGYSSVHDCDVYKIVSLGNVAHQFVPSINATNPLIRTINLLGTPFMNRFIIIDDFISKTFQLLSHPLPISIEPIAIIEP